jgi:hypothetical protein
MGCCAPHGGQFSELPWLGDVIGMSMGPHQLRTPDSHARCILDEFRLARLHLIAEESELSMHVGQFGGIGGDDSGSVGGIVGTVGICAGSRLRSSGQLVGCRVVDRRTCRIRECGCSRCWHRWT